MVSQRPAHPLRCRCGTVTGEVSRPEHGTRAVCYCRDCQAFARFLGLPTGMLDSLNGTDIVAVRPRFVTFSSGVDKLACMSLSPNGTLRWYSSCCRTPIGNTPRDFRTSHVGLVHDCLEAGGHPLEPSFGPVRMRVSPQGASEVPPRNRPIEFGLAVAKYMTSMAWTRFTGQYRVNPFFDTTTGRPIAQPQVVTAAERAKLRGDA